MKSAWLILLGLCAHLMSQNVAEAEDDNAALQQQVAAILERWEAASSRIDSLDVRFKRIERDHTFNIEKLNSGRFVWHRPNRGSYSMKPVDVPLGRNKKTRDGTIFSVESGNTESWYWDGVAIFQINDAKKTYRRFVVPEPGNYLLSSFSRSLSPPQNRLILVVDIQAKRLKDTFTWGVKRQTDEEIRLIAQPRTEEYFKWIEEVEVILDAKSLRTKATKTVSNDGTTSFIHIFEQYESKPDAESWKPDLSDYKKILSIEEKDNQRRGK